MSSFREAFNGLHQTLIHEGLLTDQLPDTDPLINFIGALQESSLDLYQKCQWIGKYPTTKKEYRRDIIFKLQAYRIFILKKSAAKSTGVSGVGETKGAGKFMHFYHAKRFLLKNICYNIYK